MVLNGAALRALRERSGYTQLALAKASGISQGRISEFEAAGGKGANVRPTTAKALAEALAVPVVALVAPPREAVA